MSIPLASMDADVADLLVGYGREIQRSPAQMQTHDLQLLAYGVRLSTYNADVDEARSARLLKVADAIDGLSDLGAPEQAYLEKLAIPAK
jgi:hypothetical protein